MVKYIIRNLYPVFLAVLTILGSCTGVAPTVDLPDERGDIPDNAPGYLYPQLNAVYPADGATGIALNTKIIVVFSSDMDSTTLAGGITVTSSANGQYTAGTDYNIYDGATVGTDGAVTPTLDDSTMFTFVFTSDLDPNDTITVSVTNGVKSSGMDTGDTAQPIENPGVYTFQTGTAFDFDLPDCSSDSTVSEITSFCSNDNADLSPDDGLSNIAIDAPITITFDENIDPTTINGKTFYLSDGTYTIAGSAAEYSPSTVASSFTFNPAGNLRPGTVYTVYATNGIMDTSGNAFGGTTWSFTTATTDTNAGNPAVDSIIFDAITATTASFSWVTDEPTDYSYDWGTGDDYPTGPVVDGNYTYNHSIDLTGLTVGQRYYMSIDSEDIATNTTNTTFQFNTETSLATSVLDNGGSDQHNLHLMTSRPPGASTGTYAFWTEESTSRIIARHFDSAAAPSWAELPIFPSSYTIQKTADDMTGGAFVIATDGSNSYYIKRVISDGSLAWGHTAAAAGEQVKAAVISNVSAVPVYRGTVSKIRSGAAEMPHLALAAYVFDHDNVFNNGSILNNDIIMDETNGWGAVLTKTTHTYIIEQSANSIQPTNTYYIGDGTANNDSSTSTSHNMNVAPDYNPGTVGQLDMIYTPHGYTLPGAWLGSNDILVAGTDYGRIIAGPTPISVSSIDSNTNATSYYVNHMYDGIGTPFSAMASGDLVENTDDSTYAHVSSKISDNELLLDSDIFELAGENYDIYQNTHSNSHDADIPNRMYRSLTNAVAANDYVMNTDTSTTTTISSIAAATDRDVTLTADIFSTATQGYTIWDKTTVHETGTPTGGVNKMTKAGRTWASTVTADDIVYVVETTAYAHIDSIADTELDLSSTQQIFNTVGNTFRIHNRIDNGSNDSVTADHLKDSTNAFGSVSVGDIVENESTGQFTTVSAVAANDLTLNADIFTAQPVNYNIYDQTFFDSGTPDSLSYGLIDSAADFTPAAVGDLVENNTNTAYARITSKESTTKLYIDTDIFANTTDTYNIYDTIESGTANSVVPNTLHDSGGWLPATPVAGDVVENTTDSTYAKITAVNGNVITIDANIFDSAADNYTIFEKSAVATTAVATSPNHMYSSGATWQTAPGDVTIGDLVRNVTDSTYTTVLAVLGEEDLTLNADLFNTTGKSYEIYNNHCLTHTGASAISPFYSFQVNWDMTVTDGTGFDIYDYRGITGTADTPPAKPLYDNDADFTAATAIAAGDIVLNVDDTTTPNTPNVATVDTGTYTPIRAKALDMAHGGAGMFADGENYEIIRFTNTLTTAPDIIETGTTTADGTGGGQLIDAGQNFALPTVEAGDYVYNITDDTLHFVTKVDNNTTLSLSPSGIGNSKFYAIIRNEGVLLTYQDGTTVYGRIITMNDNPVSTIVGEFPIAANAQKPVSFPDRYGNAIVIYEDTSAAPVKIRAVLVDAAGNISGLSAIDSQGADNESIIDTVSDGANGAAILYSYNNEVHAQRITSNGTALTANTWGANGATAGVNSLDNLNAQHHITYVSGSILVTALSTTGEVNAARLGSTTWNSATPTTLSTTINNPRIATDGTDVYVLWEDKRFFSTQGVIGIYGQKLDLGTGAFDATWYASGSGTNDTNGAAIQFVTTGKYWPGIAMTSYNNGAKIFLGMKDFATFSTNGIDLLYYTALDSLDPAP